MKNEKINLKVITHEKIVFNEKVDAVYSQGTEGRFGILPNHIPITAALDIGVTKVMNDGKSIYMTTMGGVLQFKNNILTILTDVAERGEDIDIARAKFAREEAEARIKAHENENEISKAQIALAKAMARLKACDKCE